MVSLNEQILKHASESPEGTVLFSKGLLHMGNRAAVDQSLSRLAKKRQLMRIRPGAYVYPVKTRFGDRPPDIDKALESLSKLSGETIVPSGGSAAHGLGVTTQVPVRPGLSHIRQQSQPSVWEDNCRTSTRSKVATGPSEQDVRQHHQSAWLDWPGRVGRLPK